MKQFIYVLLTVGCLLCTTTTFIEAQEIFVCTTSLPNNACLNDLEEIVACPVYNREEVNSLERYYLPIEANKRYALYNTDGKHLVAQAPIEGKLSFVWKEGIPKEEEKWMIGGGVVLSPLGTHLFVDNLMEVFLIDWKKTYNSSHEEAFDQISFSSNE